MFEKLTSVGVKPKHIIRLLPVSRQTASGWLNGHVVPHSDKGEFMNHLCAAVDKALKYNELPVPTGIKGYARDSYLETILRKYVDSPEAKFVYPK
jgi:hypothetical protein